MYYILIWLSIFIVVELILLFIYKESSGFTTTEYEVFTDKNIPRDLNVVMLSDLHDTETGNDNAELLETVDKLNPDFVLLAGDMITSYMQPEYNSAVTFSFLKKLAKNHKVYYGLGNHEQRYLSEPDKFPGKFEELYKFVNDIGITMLQDESVYIEDYNCRIYGLNIPIEYYRRVVTKKLPSDFVVKTLGKMDDNILNIMLAHNPDQFDIYVNGGPDIVVSGHIHGGIIGIPKLGGLISPQLKLFPKYDFGIFNKEHTTMILGRGIGWHTIPIRIFNKAEIVNIHIRHKEDCK